MSLAERRVLNGLVDALIASLFPGAETKSFAFHRIIKPCARAQAGRTCAWRAFSSPAWLVGRSSVPW